MTDRWEDAAYLRDDQYRDPSNLRARIDLHARFSTNPGWHAWLFDRLELRDGERVLEVGCGPGDLWRVNEARIPSIDLTLTDLSPGMLEAARTALGETRARFVEADAGSLPFSEETFDLVVANHMLYHVPERPQALRGLLRLLRPGGRLVASTNGTGHLAELATLTGHAAPRDFERFGLETGAGQLRAAGFHDVAVERFEDALEITEVEPVLAYVRSSISLQATEDEIAEVGRLLTEAIAREGSFHVTKSQGVLRARRT